MNPHQNELIQFLTDARIEAASPRGWVPNPNVAKVALVELEASLVDRNRIAGIIRRLSPLPSTLFADPMDLSDDELEKIMSEGLLGFYSLSVPRLLRLLSEPVQLVLLRESILDEMPAYWRSIIRESQVSQLPSTEQNQDSEQSDPSFKRQPMLATLDKSQGNNRWSVEVPADAVSWTRNVGEGGGSVALELEIRPENSLFRLLIELIDPIPLSASLCRVSVSDSDLHELGRYDGPVGSIDIRLVEWDGRAPLYLTCTVERVKDERFEFVVPIRRH